MIEVMRAGLLTTVQDLGRPGYAHLGVTRSGALDAPALIRANRLVGNGDGAAGLETTLTGIGLRTEIPTTMAVTGATAVVTVNGRQVDTRLAFTAPAKAVVEVGPARLGVRSYLAFAGGVSVAPVLGSRSTDTLSGLGPPPLRPGFVVPLGRRAQPGDAERLAAIPEEDVLGDHNGTDLRVRVRRGPRVDWFSMTACDTLLTATYLLSVKSNRVGTRLTGPVLNRAIVGELPSEPIVLGSVQVPADGQPLVFLADHPTTGGYPVIAVVDEADLPRLAQARPGTTVRFVGWI